MNYESCTLHFQLWRIDEYLLDFREQSWMDKITRENITPKGFYITVSLYYVFRNVTTQ